MTSDPSLCRAKYLRHRDTCSGPAHIVSFFCGEGALLRNELGLSSIVDAETCEVN